MGPTVSDDPISKCPKPTWRSTRLFLSVKLNFFANTTEKTAPLFESSLFNESLSQLIGHKL